MPVKAPFMLTLVRISPQLCRLMQLFS